MLWAIHAINWAVFQGELNWAFGIRPRTAWGLVGVIAAHFLHSEGDHLVGNTLSLIPLGGLVLLQGIGIFLVVSVISGLIAGLGTWLFAPSIFWPNGRAAPYRGASGVIFGYLGFLLVYGLLGGNMVALLIALLVLIRYGWLVLGTEAMPSGILPGHPSAWMMHLFGFIGGIVAAYLLGYARLTAGS